MVKKLDLLVSLPFFIQDQSIARFVAFLCTFRANS